MKINKAKIDEAFKNFEAIIFDLDGTLTDTMPLHYITYVKAVEKYGKAYFPKEQFYALGGVPTKEVCQIVLDQSNLSHISAETIAKDKDELFHENFSQIQPITQVLECAKFFYGSKKMGVATGSKRWSALESLESIEASHLFSAIITADDITHPKPNPEIFIKAAEVLNCETNKCVVIEDAKLGIEGAHSADMKAYHIDELKKLFFNS